MRVRVGVTVAVAVTVGVRVSVAVAVGDGVSHLPAEQRDYPETAGGGGNRRSVERSQA